MARGIPPEATGEEVAEALRRTVVLLKRAVSENNVREAEVACLRALEIDSSDLTSTVTLARVLVKKGDKKGAEDASAKARVLGWKDELAQQNEDS